VRVAGDPFPLERRTMGVEQGIGADDGRFQARTPTTALGVDIRPR